ncbi:hypothetical protein AK812_SmicGene14996 [Symbiodinium microadriaticum]|uniref:Uncharacterized protein n=1 Tax=Symbiodinium microadriaticum TaxID=2951 RepID=A0A1Q9E415_SYMMI|nr:hypothetical protein AK812_SmicGene14996 [Symbiodinium microadriaticum]
MIGRFQHSPVIIVAFRSLEEQQSGPDAKGTYLAAPGITGFPPFFQVLSQTALKNFGLMSRECFWQMRCCREEEPPFDNESVCE